MSQIKRLLEGRIAAADQFFGRCLIVNELSNRPSGPSGPSEPTPEPTSLTYQIFEWLFWASLLLSQLQATELFLAGSFAKHLNLGNPGTLFCQFKTVGVLRIEVFVIVRSWFNRAGSYVLIPLAQSKCFQMF